MERSIIAIPIGDPAGIGPEIVIKTFNHREIYDWCRPLVVGDGAVLRKSMEVTGIDLGLRCVLSPEEGQYEYGTIDLIDLENVEMSTLKFGEVQAQCGKAAFEYIKKVTDLALNKEVATIATTPINKESFKAADVPYIGHTEVLADLTNTQDPLTMFQVKDLRVFFYSRHVSLRKACEVINQADLEIFIQRCYHAMVVLGVENPRLAVAGLNPHCGEHGLFGDEEVKHIVPAIEALSKKGIHVVGPIGADSVFSQGLAGKYDAVLSLYHDQGHIATKMVDFERTIALTHNMPFLRTSVDHGTAFDIAGTGIASEVSLVEAIRLGAIYGKNFEISEGEMM